MTNERRQKRVVEWYHKTDGTVAGQDPWYYTWDEGDGWEDYYRSHDGPDAVSEDIDLLQYALDNDLLYQALDEMDEDVEYGTDNSLLDYDDTYL